MGSCPQCQKECLPSHKFCPQCGFPVGEVAGKPLDPLVGRILAGNYLLVEAVGSGGMGRVYRAEQRMLKRTVAVKIIHPSLLGDSTAAARFINEARATSQLRHPNVVGIIDFGKTDDERPFIVMEFLRGRRLDHVVRETGLLPLRRVVDVVRQVLAALAEAHALTIVHCDLKPSNIVLEPTRSGGDLVKVVDFGLAWVLGQQDDKNPVREGGVCGTPLYMSPEQAVGDSSDPRSDLYSVGVVLYELLTGHLPFTGRSPLEIMSKHLSEDPPYPGTVGRQIPSAFADTAMRALAKDPAERFQSAEEFLEALERADVEAIVEASRPTLPAPAAAEPCHVCRMAVPAGQKYCGGCGAQVASSTPPSSSDRSGGHLATGSTAPSSSGAPRRSSLVPPSTGHREADLGWLLEQRRTHTEAIRAIRIVGETGAGKTTLLRRFLASARVSGDVVVEIGGDPWWAKPAYYGLRRAIHGLTKLPDDVESGNGGSKLPQDVRIGLQCIFREWQPEREMSPDRVSGCAREALRWAISQASAGALTRRVVVGVDDWERIDSATRAALVELRADSRQIFLLMVATHGPLCEHGWNRKSEAWALRGLPLDAVQEALSGLGDEVRRWVDDVQQPALALLHVDQLRRFWMEGGTTPARSLADLIAQRMSAIPIEGQSMLHALAILGDDVTYDRLQAMLPDSVDIESALSLVARSAMVERGPEGFRWTHPLFRDVAVSLVPAGVRSQLHAKASDLADASKVPLEARAVHALHADRSWEAMFLLEQIADRATARGDDEAALEALQLGLAAARRETARAESDHPLQGVLTFGRKLGDALLRVGELSAADQLLREMLEIAGPSSPERVAIVRLIARLETASKCSDEVVGLGETVSQALRSPDSDHAEAQSGRPHRESA